MPLPSAIREAPYYRLIQRRYSGKIAKRSGVPYINHIDEGVAILTHLYAPDEGVVAAYCLHPLFQSDNALRALLSDPPEELARISPRTIILGMEYRRLANAYTISDPVRAAGDIDIGEIEAVRQMLVADKIQNKKDFVKHMLHASDRATYQRTAERAIRYFDSWLERLGVAEETYQEAVSVIETRKA